MGLDFTHCEARWAYSAFMIFRTRLAAEAGIALHCMEGFAHDHFFGDGPLKRVDVHAPGEINDTRPKALIGIQPVIKWFSVHDDIVPFLNHSDCDGVLTPDECRLIAPRLRELVSSWDDDDRDKINALDLADGMMYAADANENLEFI